MSPLRDIQNDLATSDSDITTVLRKARILTARLKNKGFEEWVGHELNGYPDKTALPKYRILHVQSRAHLIFGWQRLPRAQVMVSLIPEKYRDCAEIAYLLEGISHYASLVRDCDKDTVSLQAYWRVADVVCPAIEQEVPLCPTSVAPACSVLAASSDLPPPASHDATLPHAPARCASHTARDNLG